MANIDLIQSRIESLEEYIQHFPESPLAPIHQNEINLLQAILDNKSKEEIEHLKALL